MTSLRQRIFLSAVLAAAAFAASAQTPPPPAAPEGTATPRAERMERMRERMQQRHVEHMAQLKSKLKLDAAQESAWTAFVAAHQPPAAPAQRVDRSALANMTTPQRLDWMQQRMNERNAAFTRHADATRTFYAVLNPEQQKIFDARAMHSGPRGGRHGMHGWNGGEDRRDDKK